MERGLSINERIYILNCPPPADYYKKIAGPIMDVVERVISVGEVRPDDENILFKGSQDYEFLRATREQLGMSAIIIELSERAKAEFEASRRTKEDFDRFIGVFFLSDPELVLGRIDAALKKIEESKDQGDF